MATQKQLEEQKDIAREALRDQRYAEGRVKELREELDDYKEKSRHSMNMLERNQRSLEDQVWWMRHIIELVIVPKEKLGELNKIKQEVRMHGRI